MQNAAMTAPQSHIYPSDHRAYMQYANELARKSPPKSTNFCVGAVLVDATKNTILATGYTLELPGNTHAEQCCLIKYLAHSKEQATSPANGDDLAMYTTMEPCNKRSVGNTPCVERLIEAKLGAMKLRIQTVYIGVQEPEKFVGVNTGRTKLEEAGIAFVHVPGLEEEILSVATAGHTT